MKAAGEVGERQAEQLKIRFIQRLESLGYEVAQHAIAKGKSGAEHIFSIIAHRGNGFIAYTMVIDILTTDNQEIGV